MNITRTIEVPEVVAKKVFKGLALEKLDGFKFEAGGATFEIETSYIGSDLSITSTIPYSFMKKTEKLSNFKNELVEELDEHLESVDYSIRIMDLAGL